MSSALTLLGLLTLAAAPSLRVEITGLHSDKGTVRCLVFDRAEGFPKDPGRARMSASAKIEGDHATCVFSGLAPGKYAVSFIHDENDNLKLDTNFFGVPKEGYGFGNDAQGSMGPPPFEKAVIDLAGDRTLHLTARY